MTKTWKHAIISGAGSGLGHGLAERLLKRGAKVSVLDLTVSPERGKTLDAAAAHGGGSWEFFDCDVTKEQAVSGLVKSALTAFGPPDLAVNSAGIGHCEAFVDMSLETFRRVLDVNVIGSRNFAAAVLPHMRVGGRLALISSLAGITSNYGYAAYGTSKFAVIGLATTLRFEYEPLGIHISVVCPPEVKTPMVEKEYANGNPIALELKQIAGSIGVDEACDGIMAGIDAGKWLIVPGTKGKATAFAARRMPGTFYAVMNGMVRKLMRKHGLKVV